MSSNKSSNNKDSQTSNHNHEAKKGTNQETAVQNSGPVDGKHTAISRNQTFKFVIDKATGLVVGYKNTQKTKDIK